MGLREFLGRALLGLPPEPVQRLVEFRDAVMAAQSATSRANAVQRALYEPDDRARMRAQRSPGSELEAMRDEYEAERQRLLRKGYAVGHLALPDPELEEEEELARAEQKFAEFEVDDYLEADHVRRLN